MTTYFASPGDNLQTKTSVLQPGDSLILNDGTYSASPRLYVSGIHGTSANPITIQAAHDGSAILDGQSLGIPVFVTNCTYVTIAGMHAQNSNGNVVYVFAGSGGGNGPVDHVTLKRITASGAGSGNSHVFSTSFGATNCLLEDCAGWGQGRYIFDTYRTHDITLRRCFAYWQTVSDPSDEPRAPFNIYAADHAVLENCIGLNSFPFAADFADNNYTSLWQTTDDTTNWPTDNCSLYGCIFYNCYEGYWLNNFSGSNTTFKDCYFEIAPTATSPYTTQDHGDAFRVNGNANPHTLTNCTFRGSTRGFYRSGTLGTVTFTSNAVVGNTTGIAGTDPGHSSCGFYGNVSNGVTTVGSDVTTDPAYDTATYGRGGALYVKADSPYKGRGIAGSDIGANILYQYQNGALTTTPLWPWPMESRIVSRLGISPTYEANSGLWKTLAGLYPVSNTTAPRGMPAFALSSYAGRNTTPVAFPEVLPPSHWYALGGVLLGDQPTICTAPYSQGNVVRAGSTFVLLFQSPLASTQVLLASGRTASMTFLLYGGAVVTGPVTFVSTLVGNVFHVVCTVAADIPLSSSSFSSVS